MTSCGHEMTQPAHPVHKPVVMTSSKSSFHWAVHRSRLAGAGESSMTAIARRLGKMIGMPEIPAPDGSSPRQTKFDAPPPFIIDLDKKYTAVMDTSMGSMTIELDAVNAPTTVNSFVFLARWHYFDGIVFHRIIQGFVCQGGDPEGTGRGGPGYRFRDEEVKNPYELGS